MSGFKRLEPHHYQAIEYLSQPDYGGLKTKTAVAEAVGVSRKSLYKWLKDPLFNRELKAQIRRNVGDQVPNVLKAMADAAITEKNAKAAEIILKAFGDIITDQVEVDQTLRTGNDVDVQAIVERAKQIRKRNRKQSEEGDPTA